MIFDNRADYVKHYLKDISAQKLHRISKYSQSFVMMS